MYEKVCKNCGTLLSEFYRTGMLGCEYCYQAFEKEITIALKKLQGKTFHVGKTQKGNSLDKQLILEYERLLKERENAILNGKFEDIRELSEDILALSEELKERGLL
jgi:protein arginine kinase activator